MFPLAISFKNKIYKQFTITSKHIGSQQFDCSFDCIHTILYYDSRLILVLFKVGSLLF